MHDIHGIFHYTLRLLDLFVQVFCIGGTLGFQTSKPQVDSSQILGYDVVKFSTDPLPLIFLSK